jgi:hypothetical protein
VSAPQSSAAAGRRAAKSRAMLQEAYREGLGLAGLAVVRSAGATCIIATGDGDQDAGQGARDIAASWWCRRAVDAARVAAAATARLRRLESQDAAPGQPAADVDVSPKDVAAAIAQAAKRLHVIPFTDQQISAEADKVIARVEEEIETLQRAGQLKSVNQSYRAYRMDAAARGQKAASYADWFNKYKAKLVHELAATLRTL